MDYKLSLGRNSNRVKFTPTCLAQTPAHYIDILYPTICGHENLTIKSFEIKIEKTATGSICTVLGAVSNVFELLLVDHVARVGNLAIHGEADRDVEIAIVDGKFVAI